MEASIHVKKLTFNDSTSIEFDPNDIIVFTGANNAGKSQVLRDIQQLISYGSKSMIVHGGLLGKIGSLENLKEGCVKENDKYYLNGRSIDSHSMNHWNDKFIGGDLSNAFVNHLSTEVRLQQSRQSSSFNYLTTKPSTPIQILYADDEKEKDISELFKQAFDKEIIVNRGAGNAIPLHVGEKPTIESGEDRISRTYLEKLARLSQLDKQGDGMRSFAGILLNVFTSMYSITLIDEPEAFLHPPQARLLGRMLAKNKPNDRQLFISTHSEDFLKGLLDANSSNVKVIRINREGDVNHMSLLDNNDIKNLWSDPLLRYSNILAGLFHSKVVVCEADSDCLFYQAVMDAMHENSGDISPDILFTHCGGKARLKTVIKALKSLDVKTVVVTDIDILKGDGDTTFKDTADAMGIEWSKIEGKRSVVLEYIKGQRAQLDTDEVKKDIMKILETVMETPFPKKNIDEIKSVLKNSSAWSKVKQVGKSFLSGQSVNAYDELEEMCEQHGLFIVPVGELERFYPQIAGHGPKWVNEVLEQVNLIQNSKLRNAREFIERIVSF